MKVKTVLSAHLKDGTADPFLAVTDDGDFLVLADDGSVKGSIPEELVRPLKEIFAGRGGTKAWRASTMRALERFASNETNCNAWRKSALRALERLRAIDEGEVE